MTPIDRLHQLFDKHLSGTATEAELKELFSLADEPGVEGEFRARLSAIWAELSQAEATLPLAERDEPRQREIETNWMEPSAQDGLIEVKTKRIWFAGWWQYAAVAIIVIGIVAGTQWHTKHQQTLAKQTDFAPATNGAILTLGDGRQVALDSLSSGIIARQGNTKISKSTGSSILYESNPAADKMAPEWNTITTPRGKNVDIILPDGTHVWLNAASSIQYPVVFSGQQRNVSVTGEAYFEVAKDAAHPFIVDIHGAKAQVLGTAFNINTFDGKVVTTLVEGGLKYQYGTDSRLMKPGDQVEQENDRLTLQHDADTEVATAWKNGLFYFNNSDIRMVLKELQRWYDVDVEFQGDVPPRTIYGKMQRELYLSQVLTILKKLGINYRIENKRLVITP